jgi:hypothetical protein
MAKIPYSRTVSVSLTRSDRFPARRGFGTLLFLTSQAVVGEVDASNRTKLYSSPEEVAADFAAGDEAYKAALVAFAQNPRPIAMKVGYVQLDSAPTAVELQAQLDLIYAADQDFYFITIEDTLRDTTQLQGLIDWVEAKPKQALLDTNDADVLLSGSSASLPATNKGAVERTSFFYHADPLEYPAVALAARLSTFNFDQSNSAYTAKYKKLQGVTVSDLTSAQVQAATGFTPQLGQATATGHMTNVYIDIGGQPFVVEGSTLTPNVFIDTLHAADYIVARTEEEMLGVLLNNNRVPFTDEGMEMLAGAVRTVMAQARTAGLVADDVNPETGEYEPSVIITVPSALSVPESQRVARIAPSIDCQFRYAGAVHYATVRYEMNF